MPATTATRTRQATARRLKAITGQPLNEQDCQRLERWCEAHWFCRHAGTRRHAIAISLGLYGMRQGEVATTAMWQLRHDGMLTIRTLKHGRIRRVQLNQHLAAAIRTHHPKPADDTWPIVRSPVSDGPPTCKLFDTAMDKATKILGDHYGFHCLRHTAAMRLYYATRDVLLVMHMLGHTSLSQTHRYLQRHDPVDDRAFPRWSPLKPRTPPLIQWTPPPEHPAATTATEQWWQTLWTEGNTATQRWTRPEWRERLKREREQAQRTLAAPEYAPNAGDDEAATNPLPDDPEPPSAA